MGRPHERAGWSRGTPWSDPKTVLVRIRASAVRWRAMRFAVLPVLLVLLAAGAWFVLAGRDAAEDDGGAVERSSADEVAVDLVTLRGRAEALPARDLRGPRHLGAHARLVSALAPSGRVVRGASGRSAHAAYAGADPVARPA